MQVPPWEDAEEYLNIEQFDDIQNRSMNELGDVLDEYKRFIWVILVVEGVEYIDDQHCIKHCKHYPYYIYEHVADLHEVLKWGFQFGWAEFFYHCEIPVSHECQHTLKCYESQCQLDSPMEVWYTQQRVQAIELGTEYCHHSHQRQQSQGPGYYVVKQCRRQELAEDDGVEGQYDQVVGQISEHGHTLG